MNDLQKNILGVFKEFRRVCEENNLRYYAIGGTCLGAIRHNGFIPWDDDLDVAMPFDDYQKFRKKWQTMLRKPYQVLDHEKTQHCEFDFIKMFNGNTTFIEQSVRGMPDRYTGVFIDIMPITGWPDDKDVANRLQKKIIWLRRFDRCARFRMNRASSTKTKVFRAISAPLWMGKPYNHYSLQAEAETSSNAFGTTENVLFPWRDKGRNVFPYDWFKEPLAVPFEDTTITVPLQYDAYLKKDFGNYMQLPPLEEQRSVHPAAIIDFHKSYREYQEAVK